MDTPRDESFFLTLPEIRTLFSRLKTLEGDLLPRERMVLRKIEGILYERHSVEEIEALLAPPGGDPSP
jgi:hypothetical protein